MSEDDIRSGSARFELECLLGLVEELKAAAKEVHGSVDEAPIRARILEEPICYR